MSPLPILRRGLFFTLLLSLINTTTVSAQTPQEVEKMTKDAEFFPFHLKFRHPDGPSLEDTRYQKITGLLETYKKKIPGDIQRAFLVEGGAENNKPALSPEQQSVLKEHARQFLKEVGQLGLSMMDMQRYAGDYRIKNPRPGDNGTEISKAWKENFLGLERSLMGGRNILVLDTWKQTMISFFKTHPDAAGVVFGQADIGSWVKGNVKDYSFSADIDFSTFATEKGLNVQLKSLFNTELEKISGLGMIQLQAQLTAHGSATPEVYIGDWGKVFAEVQILKEGTWQLLEVEKDANQNIIDIRKVDMPAKELFMRLAVQEDAKSAKKDPANCGDPRETHPQIKIEHEPMLSLEMLRHALFDIDGKDSPFKGAEKIIKFIKFTDRSFFAVDEALKTVSEQDKSDYFSLTQEEQQLKNFCKDLIDNKKDNAKIAQLLETYTGKQLQHNDQVNLIVNDLVEKCKKAMLRNINQAFGYRLRSIARIEDEGKRFDEAEKFLKQIDEEFKKGYEAGKTPVPEAMKKARALLAEFRAGKIPADQLDAKLKELNELMEREYHIDKSFVERWVGDSWNAVKKFFIEKGYTPEAAQKIAYGIKEKITSNWNDYAPENLKKPTITAYEQANWVRNGLGAYNDQLAKTKVGRALDHPLLDQLDNAVALYDAWLSGKTLAEKGWKVSVTAVTIGLMRKYPELAIPLGIFNSMAEKKVGPAALAVFFYAFPVAGQSYMVTNLIDRLILTNIQDITFRSHLDKLSLMAQTDGQGHVLRFRLPVRFDGLLGSPDSVETSPDIPIEEPGRLDAIKNVVFENGLLTYCPHINYFSNLVPTRNDQYGLYDTKLKKMMGLFSFEPEFVGCLKAVEKFKEEHNKGTWKNNGDPTDIVTNRINMLDSLELAIANRMWAILFSAIESSKIGEKKGEMDKLEADILRIQDLLRMDEFNMKKIEGISLLRKIREQIDNDPLYKEALKDKYSVGTAYNRIAIPTFKLYIDSYQKIINIQTKLFDFWRSFGVDITPLHTAKGPMRLLLMGGPGGAPMLLNDRVKDLQLALQCLEAHTSRGNTIRADLANALGRPVNEKDAADMEYLRNLAQLGFEFERLVDAGPVGRSPAFVDKDNQIANLRKQKLAEYKAYLEKIKEGPAIKVTLKVDGEKETTETNPVTARVTIINDKNQPVLPPAGTTLEWYLFDEITRKETKLIEGNQLTHQAAKQGYFAYTVRLIKKANNKLTEVARANWNIQVARFNASDPTKGIQLNVPALIRQYDVFDATITVPAAIKDRQLQCNWGYNTVGKNDDCSGARIQFNYPATVTGKDRKQYPADSTTVDVTVTLIPPGKTKGEVYQVSKKVKFQPMSIQVKMSDIWEGSSGANWFQVERKSINNPPRYAGWMDDPSLRPRSTASVSASINFRDKGPSESFKTPEELKSFMDNKVKEESYRKMQVRPVTVGDFKGFGLYSEPPFSPGRLGFSGHIKAAAGASFSGYVIKGKKIFQVEWSVSASGGFDDVDKGWMMSMLRLITAEAEGILAGASFQPDGRITKTPYTGPKPDGSDFPQVSIEPKVDNILPGAKVSVRAVIQNDKPEYRPYTYTWSGHVDGHANGSTVQLDSERPGKKTISVTVDGTIPPGSASIEYTVAPLNVNITKISPSTPALIVGMPVDFRADISGPVPTGKKLQYLWQPHPQEKFNPFEGTGNTTRVVFTVPGNKKIWVEVLDKTTAETISMGKSDQLEFVVEKPGFTISFNPAKARVGEEVVAKISSMPEKLEEVSYRWMPLPSNAQQLKESQDGTELTFYAKNALQIPFEVLSVVKGTGEELGRTKAYFNAERYAVKAEGPKVQGPKPMIWKPGVGLVEVEKEIAVHQIIEFSAVVTPAPSSDLTYNWQVTEGNASISNPASRDARVTALETGNVIVTVTVKDKNGVELGNGSGSFNASISQEMISNANTQKKLFEEKMRQARQLMEEGKLDEAVKLGQELKEMNAKDAAPLLQELGAACRKAATVAVTERDFDLATKRCAQAQELNPNDAAAKKQWADIKKWEQEWTVIQSKGNELETHVRNHDLPSAEKTTRELTRLQAGMPGQASNKWTDERLRLYNALVKSCDSAYSLVRSRSTLRFNNKEFEACKQELESFKTNWIPQPAVQQEIENTLQRCRDRIATQKSLYDEFVAIKSGFEKGNPPNPQKGPDYIEVLARNNFSENDPRQKEMVDFAGVMRKRLIETSVLKAQAEKLKAEGKQAEDAGQIETAIRKYKESTGLYPDPQLEEHIRVLEEKIKEPPVIQGNWFTRATEYRQQIGKRYTFFFPPGGTITNRVWGTIIYTDDGSIAQAAVHMGLITVRDGGTVTIEIGPGQPSFVGSTRNGVTSSNYGSWDRSIAFVKNGKVITTSDSTNPDRIEGDWNTLADYYSGNFGKQYTFHFPPGGTISSRVWGTDVYTCDCSIASAAVHAGLITPQAGGTVTIEIKPGQASYKGTTRNGVTSKDWGAFTCSFVFITGQKKPPPPVTETWKGTFNVAFGAYVELQVINGQYTGRMSIAGSAWEKMEDLVIKDNKISFHRVNGDQYYNGTISGSVMKGTFTSGGRTGQHYDWELRREAAPGSSTTPRKPGYTIEEVGGGVRAEQICITGTVKRPDGQPAPGALITAGGIVRTTANNAGEFTLKDVPAGLVTVHASYNNHHHININTDLASGKTIRITINLPPD